MNLLEATALFLEGKLKTESYYHSLENYNEQEANEAYRNLVRQHPADIKPRNDSDDCEVFDYKDGLVIELHPETMTDENKGKLEVDYAIFDSEEDRKNGYDWNILVDFGDILKPDKYWNIVKEWAVKARANSEQREKEATRGEQNKESAINELVNKSGLSRERVLELINIIKSK